MTAAAPRPGVLSLLREPRWLRGLALAVAVALVCVVLGQWQWHRRQERLARNAPLVTNYDRSPVDVGDVLPRDGRSLESADTWTPVRVSGTYDAAATLLARNRPWEEATGYEVLVPLLLPDGSALLVDRGWLPAGSASAEPDTVPAPPTGTVDVVVRVRAWEPQRPAQVPDGQVASIAREPVAQQTVAAGVPALLGGYGVLASEDPSPTQAPLLALRPDVDEGPHLAYTVQWYGFAITALVVWVVAGRRELEARDGAEFDVVEAAPPRPRRAGRGGPPRRGSDEEAEDAALDDSGSRR